MADVGVPDAPAGRAPHRLGLGALVSALAPSIEVLLAGRLIQGLGAGCGVTIARAIARDRYGTDSLVTVIAYLTMASTLGPTFSPLISGVLVDTLGWRSVLWFSVAAGGLILAAAYQVLRHEDTELAFTSPLHENHQAGIYYCAGCDLPAYSSEHKFDSGTGWPSFFHPFDASHIATIVDTSHGMRRVETRCARCDGHLGHVFDDGPAPTGLRYCLNSAALAFAESQR